MGNVDACRGGPDRRGGRADRRGRPWRRRRPRRPVAAEHRRDAGRKVRRARLRRVAAPRRVAHAGLRASTAGPSPTSRPSASTQRPDARSDVYGLGAVLFELVTRRTAVHRTDAGRPPEPILSDDTPLARSVEPKVDRDVEAVLARALARDPARRYPDMARVRLRSRGARPRGAAVRAPPGPPRARHARWRGGVRRRSALAAFALVFLAAWSVVAIVKNRKLARNLERAKHRERPRDQRGGGRRRRTSCVTRGSRTTPAPGPAAPRPPARSSDARDRRRAARVADGRVRAHRGSSTGTGRRSRSCGVAGAKIADRPGEGVVAFHAARSGAPPRRGTRRSSRPGPAMRIARRRSRVLRRHLARLEKQPPRSEDDWSYETDADAWQDATLSTLSRDWSGSAGPRPRRERSPTSRGASTMPAASSRRSPRAGSRWEAAGARSRIRSAARGTAGSRIDPQLGLVPIGRNPDTGSGSSSTC